mgnify:FL=1|tara:strand:- start:2092 stop:2997 length:906 start_codon:yes stop_codon:yes gene_type:complete
MNFLYCFDNNFNLQALNSINSIIKYSNNVNLNFYIIHDSPKTFLKILDRYLPDYKNLITIYKFDFDSIKFPRINKAHVTKATYFRLFFQKYLPKNIEFITYVDSDIICLSNPEKRIQELIETIDNSNLLIGAVNEDSLVDQNVNRLDMKSDRYFNAGVMIINLKQWSKKIEINEIILSMEKLRDKIKWWDQDVLNVLVDGNYLELKKDFNMKASEIKGMPDESVVFLHYAGKGKPWDNSFFEDPNTNIYQNAFLRTGFSEYHIDPKGFIENILFFKHLFSNKYKQFNKKKLFSSYIKNKLI